MRYIPLNPINNRHENDRRACAFGMSTVKTVFVQAAARFQFIDAHASATTIRASTYLSEHSYIHSIRVCSSVAIVKSMVMDEISEDPLYNNGVIRLGEPIQVVGIFLKRAFVT